LDNNETNSALVHLYKFFPAIYDCAFIQSEQAFKTLEDLIKLGQTESAQYSTLLDVMHTHLNELRQVLQPSLLNQI
jgi:DNA-directed RNA polymerase subunit F